MADAVAKTSAQPLLNKVLNALYPPGSTIKPMTRWRC